MQERSDTLRIDGLEDRLSALVERDPRFGQEVDVTSGRLSVGELLRNIARASGVNLSVRSVDQTPVTCNFTRTRVDVLLRFLCLEYRLDIEVTGNIVSVFPAAAPANPAPDPDIVFEARDTSLSFDLHGERLIDVTKKITRLTGRNIIVPQTLYDHKVSGYVRRMPFAAALLTLGEVNGLLAERSSDDIWSIRDAQSDNGAPVAASTYARRRSFDENELRVDSLGRITAHIAHGDAQDIVLDLCEQMNLNHYFRTPLSLTVGIWVDDIDFETLLAVLLKGSEYSFYEHRGIWIFGAAASDRLGSATVVELEYRSVSKAEELIPSTLKEGVEIKSFPDLNALILGGDRRDVSRTEAFLRSIDRPVPLITMEIIIAEVQRSDIREMGIGGGVGSSPATTSGTLGDGVDMTFGAGAVNNLLHRIRGTVNLGRVTPNFYHPQALDAQRTRSGAHQRRDAVLQRGAKQLLRYAKPHTVRVLHLEIRRCRPFDQGHAIRVARRAHNAGDRVRADGVHGPHRKKCAARNLHAQFQIHREGSERGDGSARRARPQQFRTLLARHTVSCAGTRHKVVLREREAQQDRTLAQHIHQTDGNRIRTIQP